MKVKEESEKVGSKLSIQEIKIMASSHITSWQMKWSESHSVMSNSLWPHGLYSPWNPPGQNTGVGSLSLPQGIFPTQGSNPALPHCRRILYQLSHKGSLSRQMTNRWGKVETMTDFIFLSSKSTADSDRSHQIKRCFLLEKKAMTNLDKILTRRTLLCQQRSVCFF